MTDLKNRRWVMYYSDKLETLRDIFGSDEVKLDNAVLAVGDICYPIIDDVIILLDPSQYPPALKAKLGISTDEAAIGRSDFAEDIQFTFGQEWQRFPHVLPEHEKIFLDYFDLIDLSGLKDFRVCDLGCGIGRWSYFLKDKCRELVLMDFSEAIFVARCNLRDARNALFFMGDLKRLPFREDFADFIVCLGVLHHLSTPALGELRRLKKYAPALLIYLYYALDNRPVYFRIFLCMVTAMRRLVSKIRNPLFRSVFTWLALLLMYLPLIRLGRSLRPLGLSKHVPLYEAYHDKGVEQVRQDVYDRFFTRIEQRFSRDEILGLRDSFAKVTVSSALPYWHFICERVST